MTAKARREPYETPQRRVILRTLATAPGYISAQTLHEQLRRAGERIALTTVYRALHRYAAVGRIDTAYDTSGEQLFHTGRGHYLVCRACGSSRPVDAGVVTDWAESQATEHGFADINPVIELTGLCADCTPQGPPVERS
jgi:Fur family ferric uptake transcriptional regulator